MPLRCLKSIWRRFMLNDVFLIPVLIISFSLILVLVTFLSSKTLQEKVVAFDVMTISTTSILAFVAFIKDAVFYLDIAVVYAVLSFIGVVVIARYQEKGM